GSEPAVAQYLPAAGAFRARGKFRGPRARHGHLWTFWLRENFVARRGGGTASRPRRLYPARPGSPDRHSHERFRSSAVSWDWLCAARPGIVSPSVRAAELALRMSRGERQALQLRPHRRVAGNPTAGAPQCHGTFG